MEERPIVTKGALHSALVVCAAAFKALCDAIVEKITTKSVITETLEVANEMTVHSITADTAQINQICAAKQLFAKHELISEDSLVVAGDATIGSSDYGGTVTAQTLTIHKNATISGDLSIHDLDCSEIVASSYITAGQTISAPVLSAKDLSISNNAYVGSLDVGGYISAIDGPSQFQSVTCGDIACATIEAEGAINVRASSGSGNGGITADGDVVAPNITAMQADVDKLKCPVRIMKASLTGASNAASALQMTLDADPYLLFGGYPWNVQGYSVRARAICPNNTISLGTCNILLKWETVTLTDGSGKVRPVASTGVITYSSSRYLPKPGSSLSGTFEISINYNGTWKVVDEVPFELTCAEKS